MKPTISIITVTYNSEKTLEQTMQSVLNQTYLPKEYLIIDGASTDSTMEIVNSLASDFSDKGIKLISVSEKDNGIYDAMNKGIKMAAGDVIGIINSDDWYEEDALMTVADTYDANEFDLFYADLNMVKNDGTSFVKKSRNRKYATSRDWNHPTTFIASKIYKNNYYHSDTIHDDYDLILRIKKQGAKTVVVNKVIANFRMNGVSHTRSLPKALERVKIKYGIYRQNGYSRFYLFECLLVEFGKLLIG